MNSWDTSYPERHTPQETVRAWHRFWALGVCREVKEARGREGPESLRTRAIDHEQIAARLRGQAREMETRPAYRAIQEAAR